jgi:hypothetical protein
MTRVGMWGVVVASFAVAVFSVWAMWGGIPFLNSVVAPLVHRFYTPGIELVLFGPSITACAISIWFIKRCHGRSNRPIPVATWFIVAVLTVCAAYLGPFFAVNSFGE